MKNRALVAAVSAAIGAQLWMTAPVFADPVLANPLIVAGGGGGAGYSGAPGGAGQTGPSGESGLGPDGGAGGLNGSGGAGGTNFSVAENGGGGGGWLGNGGNGVGSGPVAPFGSGDGGLGAPTFTGGVGDGGDGAPGQKANGGFGGGGGGGYQGGGGGGGYSGGGGGDGTAYGGGGGGSYISSLFTGTTLTGGYNGTSNGGGGAGLNGWVEICLVGSCGGPADPLFGSTDSIATYTIPVSGDYFIQAVGAQGGSGSNSGDIGGYGALASGNVSLDAGTTLDIVAGGAGETGDFGTLYGGGGGGGSFVYLAPASAVPEPSTWVLFGGGLLGLGLIARRQRRAVN